MSDRSKVIQQQLQQAIAQKQSIKILAGNSLQKFSPPVNAEQILDISQHSGIIHYAPEELVVQVRAATPLSELVAALAEKQQQLPFEPPMINSKTTIGGIIACALSGHSRIFHGDVKDALLGVRMLNGKAENLVFGGTVIKNVAGFDLARLQAGSFGRYGILLDLAIKVIPKAAQCSYRIRCDEQQALKWMQKLRQLPLPITALSYYEGSLMLRINHPHDSLPPFISKVQAMDNDFWQQTNHYQHAFFQTRPNETLSQIRLPFDTPALSLSKQQQQMIHAAGAIRWIKSTASIEPLLAQLQALGGYYYPGFYLNNKPYQSSLSGYYQKLKQAFDPELLLNPES